MSVTSMTKRIAMAVCGLALIAGCGSSSHSSSHTTTISVATPPTTDSCLVGKWEATNQSVPFQTSDGTTVALAGGQDDILTLTADGRYTEDQNNSKPDVGSDGVNHYSLTSSGIYTGHYTASGGVLTVTVDDPAAVTSTLYENGTAIYTQPPQSGPLAVSYTCRKGVSLTTSASGGANITTLVPAK
jgi:hypothetical protein